MGSLLISMRKRCLYLSLLICFQPALQAEINWTPHLDTIFAEGTSVSTMYFSDGDKKYAILLDGETKVESVDGGAKLTFLKPTSTVFKIRAPMTVVALPVTPDLVAEYRKHAQAYAPKDVSVFSDFEEAPDAYRFTGSKSYRVQFSYAHFGQRIRHSVTFLTFVSGQQVVFDISSYEKDFPVATLRADQMILSWCVWDATPKVKACGN